MSNGPYTFFSYPFNYAVNEEHAIRLLGVIPDTADVIMITDSNSRNSEAARKLKKLVDERHDGQSGEMISLRTSGPWNKLWKTIYQIERWREDPEEPLYTEAGQLWFISLVPPEVIHQALKRHRVIGNLTNTEQYFLATRKFGEEHDEIIAMTLNQPSGYMTTDLYKDLTVEEAFDLTSYEGLRFMRPVHDVDLCARIMHHMPVPIDRKNLAKAEVDPA